MEYFEPLLFYESFSQKIEDMRRENKFCFLNHYEFLTLEQLSNPYRVPALVEKNDKRYWDYFIKANQSFDKIDILPQIKPSIKKRLNPNIRSIGVCLSFTRELTAYIETVYDVKHD
ncbi:hypothetical protein PN466_09715 [Roseofilum reptotaenium CS-1145]|uniref:Uncharacterized protein n=1 Tax=Roseofilum reptotaenium AO1-A TaxID=1925591 RepID=A0A1L9QJC2_9CYAN|nr:hypothetical protein [Roseofilum reptotaenium]MDB9517224.1 hypothetical protein [Roseofilum reptotaenium CS-1145]OJJ13854.1 hypothetical protein BI308_25530 [Roseofilum reptotaenium AO1-A]